MLWLPIAGFTGCPFKLAKIQESDENNSARHVAPFTFYLHIYIYVFYAPLQAHVLEVR